MKFGLRTKIGRVTDACGFQIGFSSLGDGAGIAVVAVAGGRIGRVTRHDKRAFFAERIQTGAVRISDKNHVACLNPLPTVHRRAVKRLTFFKPVFINSAGRDAHVHLFALDIREAKIDKFDIVVLNHLQDVFNVGHFLGSFCSNRWILATKNGSL